MNKLGACANGLYQALFPPPPSREPGHEAMTVHALLTGNKQQHAGRVCALESSNYYAL